LISIHTTQFNPLPLVEPAVLERIEIPTLVVSCRDDDLVPPRNAVRLARRPNGRSISSSPSDSLDGSRLDDRLARG